MGKFHYVSNILSTVAVWLGLAKEQHRTIKAVWVEIRLIVTYCMWCEGMQWFHTGQKHAGSRPCVLCFVS